MLKRPREAADEERRSEGERQRGQREGERERDGQVVVVGYESGRRRGKEDARRSIVNVPRLVYDHLGCSRIMSLVPGRDS